MDPSTSLFELAPEGAFRPVLLPPEVVEHLRGDDGQPVRLPTTGGAAVAQAICERENERWVVRLPPESFYRIIRVGERVVVSEGEPRHYRSTILPTLQADEVPPREELLIALYSQVAQSWRYLTDVRFKLIGLIPAISVIVWAQLASSETLESGVGAGLGLAICLLAVGLIGSLRTYDRRNDELYDDTISRGRKIEEELGVDTGLFRGRPTPRVRGVSHGLAVEWIYRLAFIGWFLLAAWFILALLR